MFHEGQLVVAIQDMKIKGYTLVREGEVGAVIDNQHLNRTTGGWEYQINFSSNVYIEKEKALEFITGLSKSTKNDYLDSIANWKAENEWLSKITTNEAMNMPATLLFEFQGKIEANENKIARYEAIIEEQKEYTI